MTIRYLHQNNTSCQRIEKMRRLKNKIHHKCEDSYERADLKEGRQVKTLNLTIKEFDARGLVRNPQAPCLATAIDPNYSKDARLQHRTKPFRIKTDILKLREVVRTKFLVFATKEYCLEKQQQKAQQEQIYQHIKSISEFIAQSLDKIEREAFSEMRDAQKRFEELQKVKIADELKEAMAEHQRVMMEVQEIFGRFMFLLKLICYFDDIIDPEDIEQNGVSLKISMEDILHIQIADLTQFGQRDLTVINDFMNKTIRPYLAKRNHLNANIWIKGFELSRQKFFNYYRGWTQVALLNHLIYIMHTKSEKSFQQMTEKPVILKNSEFLKERSVILKKRALKIMDKFEKKEKTDKLQRNLHAIVPVVVEKLENRSRGIPSIYSDSKQSSRRTANADESVLVMVEKLQWHVMKILQDLEKISMNQRQRIERDVRKRSQTDKRQSHKALIEQIRLHNWMEHFKKHLQQSHE